jgi:hypothetical protein
LNILVLSSPPDTATVNTLAVCLGISIFHWTIEHSENQRNPADLPAILYFPSLKQFGITVAFSQADIIMVEKIISLINGPVVESLRLTLDTLP